MPLDFDYVGVVQHKTRVGQSHSYTAEETRAESEIRKYVLLANVRGDTLTDYTKPDWYYCIVEDGSIFKCSPKEPLFYELDLTRFVWIPNQRFASIYYDTYLRFQEIPGFRDYFPMEKPDTAIPEVEFTFRGDPPTSEELQELIEKRNQLLCEMGLPVPGEEE